MRVFLNHVGYEPDREKSFLVEPGDGVPLGRFCLVDATTGQVVHTGPLVPAGPVARWRDWSFWQGEFSSWTTPGTFWIDVPTVGGQALRSDSFNVSPGLYRRELLTDLLHYFKSQRCSHHWDRADGSAPLIGSTERFDVHGGWYDASGDVSKYLSHLSYANYLNPQQTPLVVWSLLSASESLADMPSFFRERLVDEACHGADFLVRMQHPSGAFFMTLFDQWNKDPESRVLCAYQTRQGTRTSAWQAGYRHGGSGWRVLSPGLPGQGCGRLPGP